MCYHFGLKADRAALEKRYRTNLLISESVMEMISYANAFTHPLMPIFSNDDYHNIVSASWGFIPFWAKDSSIQKNTVNARIETINTKPAFRHYVVQRCLIPFTYFIEWQWLDPKGKSKQKFGLSIDGEFEIYSFAGLFSDWTNPETAEVIRTFTILTTDANEIMSEIHNTKKRMPVIIHPNNEMEYLNNGTIEMINNKIIATKV